MELDNFVFLDMPITASAKLMLGKLIRPVSIDEDKARREFIFNVISLTIVALSLIVLCINLAKSLVGGYNAVSVTIVFILFIFFSFLYFLSRKGHALLASVILLTLFSLVVTYMEYKWGTDLPMKLLSQALIIVMAGVLINTRAAFAAAILMALSIGTISYFHKSGSVEPDRYWVSELWAASDVIVAAILLLIISTVSWLSNREIEKSLKRARKSEMELKRERDNLELTVEERTRELKEAEAEKMAQLYRFAEFGRLSSGLFHDLINPLNAVSLNMEKLKERAGDLPIKNSVVYVDQAIKSARKLEDLVLAVRKQLSRDESSKSSFSLNEEIKYVRDVLVHKAARANVALNLSLPEKEVMITGNPIKFNQVVLNLMANAIDAYSGLPDEGRTKEVLVSLKEEPGAVVLQVKDNGAGIAKEDMGKIYEPFFTTKKEGQGMGIGLSTSKRIIEKDFSGKIKVQSDSSGTTFTVELKNE